LPWLNVFRQFEFAGFVPRFFFAVWLFALLALVFSQDRETSFD
jgi:hypothetical protein